MDDGLALMRAATAVSVVMVHERGEASECEAQSKGLLAHLGRHGVPADVVLVSRSGERVGDLLLEQCAAFGADLLIMGAYGHPRARELVLGGATRTMFAHARQPILMSH
jgi:nucleotide-binding universal stress UspA family protein